jgi:hypothetical protein
MIKKNIISAGVVFILATSVFQNTAKSESKALVALYDGANSWERIGHLQTLLEKKYGFTKAQVLVNSTPDEIPELVHEFLSKPGMLRDKRFVWVSGMGPKNENSPCPNPNLGRVQPSVDTLVFAPECYSDLIRLPYGAKHVSVGRSGESTPKRGRKAARLPSIALLALPSDKPEFIEGADGLIMEFLASEDLSELNPYHLLDGLRNDFRENGSDYTPSLDIAAWRGAFITSTHGMNIPDIHPSRQHIGAVDGALPVVNILSVYRSSKENTGPAFRIFGYQPISVLRSDSSGRMVFVRVRGGRYGWVNSGELRL